MKTRKGLYTVCTIMIVLSLSMIGESVVIKNCATYNSTDSSKCQTCQGGFILTINKNQCVKNISNC